MEHRLDVSTLVPCEPMAMILQHLGNLPDGDHLRVIHRMEPRPLYPILQEMGFSWETRHTSGDGAVEILIRRAQGRSSQDAA